MNRKAKSVMAEARMLQGDCLEVLPTLPANSVDMVFCDLPYAYVEEGRVRGCTANDWDAPIDIMKLWAQLLRIATESAAFVFTATNPFAAYLINSNIKLFRYDLVWHKTRSVGYFSANKQPLRAHEMILVFCRKGAPYTPQMSKGTPYVGNKKKNPKDMIYGNINRVPTINNGDRYPRSVLNFNNVAAESGLHATPKPTEMMRWLIRTYCPSGGTVLDPTAGSASTLLGALLSGVDSIGIEKDPIIFANAKERVMAVQRSLRPRPADGKQSV